MTMSPENVLDKVRKLLRLANSPNPNEAALAAAKAQQLIDAHKLNTELLALDGEAETQDEPIENFARKDAPLDGGRGGKNDTWRWRLANTVMRANACRGYVSRGNVEIVGRPSDVETVRYVYAYLKAEMEQLVARDGTGCGRTWRNNYRHGVVDTIALKFREQHDQFKREAVEAASASSTALVRVNTALARMDSKGAAVDTWIKGNIKLVSGGSARVTQDPGAREHGRKAGQAISLNRAKRSLTA